MSLEGAVVLGVVGCSAYAIGYYCLRVLDKKEARDKVLPLTSLTANSDSVEIHVGLSDTVDETDNWKEFKRRHVVTTLEFPLHRGWDAKEWNDFFRIRNIFNGNEDVLFLISVEREEEVLQDFESPFIKDQLERYTRHGNLYKSAIAHRIYHAIRPPGSKDDFKIYRNDSIHYLACVETTNLANSQEQVHFVRVPVRFESRYDRHGDQVTESEEIM